jgi:hypothetical protein
MPCLVGCLALAFPRLAIILTWLFSPGYLAQAVQPMLWLILGFFFLPLTTLVFAYGVNSLGAAGTMPPLGWLLAGLAVLVDLGLLGGGSRQARVGVEARRR